MRSSSLAHYNHSSNGVCQFLIIMMITALFVNECSGVEGYKNYTVGDSLGWFDTLEKPSVDYRKWAADKIFSLGDFLIFNTDNNHSVIQTYNFTTYSLCDYGDSLNNDTIEWSAADPSSVDPRPVSVSVPLVKTGMTYFFSSDYDGEQCQNGQNLKINVTYGQGLPSTLVTPSGDSPAPISPESGDEEAAPETLVPSNFDNPKDISDDESQLPSNAVSLSGFYKLLIGVQVVVGLFSF
ncbi:hypothetical protein ABFS82_04G067200 [Erythranthe guttata]|uniref:Phytocyanin domain-containing protein n=1 Tax=Erythranthe guttata TaxID=4155 RepID=A0A022S2N5_ERYGU|nr:PREDICTED: blue copper protein [Erythranthe guttata]EYU46173.1 hypothetical protein MIMGU_mgv1a012871mg [Erythranthe guttata]|eukprot:XP_012855667.1 PREDICTED: blue copper protein [Erythranthe guttata]